eukprot:1191168-Prorocentrum_minimum.AAC.1
MMTTNSHFCKSYFIVALITTVVMSHNVSQCASRDYSQGEDATRAEPIQISTAAVLVDTAAGTSVSQRRNGSVVEQRGNVVQLVPNTTRGSYCRRAPESSDEEDVIDGDSGDISLLGLKSKFAPKSTEASLRSMYVSPRRKPNK